MEPGNILNDEEIKQEVQNNKNYYSVVEMNTIFYLNNRMYTRIEELHNLSNVKTLYLNNNDLKSINGLQNCLNLIALYLNGNHITKIENLSNFKKLMILNLENNKISVIENLEELTSLVDLNLSNNCLGKNGNANISHLKKNKKLSFLNLSNNFIDEDILNDFDELEELTVLYMKGNPMISGYKNYRKHFIHRLKNITYLDDNPVTLEERRCVEAFFKGGIIGEQKEREEIAREKKLQHEKYLENFRKMIRS